MRTGEMVIALLAAAEDKRRSSASGIHHLMQSRARVVELLTGVQNQTQRVRSETA